MMMTSRPTPAALHDVLGARFVPAQLATMLAFAAITATAVIAATQELPLWRLALAWLLIADIAAGCLVNFTRSTNDFYAARPRHRWIFIAAHLHVLAVAWLLQASLTDALRVWAYTIACAAIVNLLMGRASARFVAATLLAGALVLIASLKTPSHLSLVYSLFYLKVAFAFALDHLAPADAETTLREGLVALTHRDRREARALIADAFQDDPLFVQVSGEDPTLRRMFAGYLFDMVSVMDGAPWGWFEGGRLQAVMLLERRGADLSAHTLGAAARFIPLATRLGLRRSRWLNRYFLTTRACAPDAPHHYLTLLAVAPHAQGTGIGRRMVEAAWSQTLANPTSTALALDTENEANVALYQRLGFERVTQTSVETTPIFTLVRRRDAR